MFYIFNKEKKKRGQVLLIRCFIQKEKEGEGEKRGEVEKMGAGINTGGGGGGGEDTGNPPPKIWLNCQWFMMAFMLISLHEVIIIELMFKS